MECIKIRQYDIDGIAIEQFDYVEEIADFLRSVPPVHGRWFKMPDGSNVYWTDWETAPSLCDMFLCAHMDSTELFGLITLYNSEPHKIPLKKITALRYKQGWFSIRVDSVCYFDLDNYMPQSSFRWYKSKENKNEILLAVKETAIVAFINVLEEQKFDTIQIRRSVSELNASRAKMKRLNSEQDEKKKIDQSCSESVDNSEENLTCEPEYPLLDVKALNLPFEPYSFQLEDARMMLQRKKMINASDMGLGKTFESILVGESLPMKKLVICPASLRINWRREILQVNPDADVSIIYSNDKELIAGNDWTIIGYPSLSKMYTWLFDQKFPVMFFDEAHYAKAVTNSGKPDSIRAGITIALADSAEYCFPITGTPKANRNRDLFNMLRLVKHPLAKSEKDFWGFGQKYCNAYHDNFGWHMDGNSNDIELYGKIKNYMIRRLKKNELPNLKKQRIILPVEAKLKDYKNAWQRYNQIKDLQEDPEDKGAMGALQKARQYLAIAKTPQSIDFANTIIDRGESVVVVTCFSNVVEAFKTKFKDKCSIIIGGMSDKAKQKEIDDFQKGIKPLLVMNVIAGGVGITLTKAHIMIINDMDWVIGNVTQAEDRICRTGQKENCVVYYMVAEDAEIDEILRKSLTRKSNTLNTAIDGGKGQTVKLIEEERVVNY